MASSATSEAIEIRRRGRQRLIGAIALVALLVVFVPMLLDKEPKPAANGPALAIPPKDNAPPMPLPPPAKGSPDTPKPAVETPKVTAEAPSKAADTPAKPVADAPAVQAAPAPAVPTAATQPAPSAKTESKAATVSPAPAKTDAKPAPAATAQPPKAGFAVQVGAFRDEAKLKQARDKLAAAKVPHYTERLDAKGGNLTRLRAGPFDTREQAEAALAALKRSALDGKVVPLP
jgi:DedD protein